MTMPIEKSTLVETSPDETQPEKETFKYFV